MGMTGAGKAFPNINNNNLLILALLRSFKESLRAKVIAGVV